ncbi:PepSY-associated TM helix domain-containing protein [Singulisphaera sp. PoT]|uniref:PepSY-associated TM helix domain-containing protein n=1 Tax=Singulisphaera sp. PoT TaxID=3411797 RepID=UPI003BF46BBC
MILPAPLVATGRRWGYYAGAKPAIERVIKVVTAFTIGHSITLVIGALGWASLPSAIVESVIALSILVSAGHALVPIFRGREVYIAGGFGLAHGLAFASTLTGFGFDSLTLVSSVLGFNLGIEAFQLLVIFLMMPWLLLLARSRAYGPFRVIGASLTAIAAAAWFAERAFGTANPIAPIVEAIASHPFRLLAGLVALTLGATFEGFTPLARDRRSLDTLEPALTSSAGSPDRKALRGAAEVLSLTRSRQATARPAWKLDAAGRTAERLTPCPLSLNSMAKDYIIGRARQAALDRSRGIQGVLLNISGDARVVGDVARTVGIAPPVGDSEAAEPIDRKAGRYDLTETHHGFVAVINDLHKGRDTGKAWSALIDASAIAPAVISLTGLVLLLYLKRRRIPGLLVMVGGMVAVVAVFLRFIS